MKLLKIALDFYLDSSIHVAINAAALTWVSLLEFDIGFDSTIIWFVFFATITGYNFVKYYGVAKFHHRSLVKKLKVIQVFSFLAFLVLCYFTLQLKLDTIFLIAALGLITLLYALPLLPKAHFIDEHKNLREIGGLKVFVVAGVWAFTTVVLPLFNEDVLFTEDAVITVVQRFIFILVVMLPFEIRDLSFDSLKLATIPQKIGVKRTKIIGILLLILIVFSQYFKDELFEFSLLPTLAIMFVTLLFVVFSYKGQSKYYSAFWIESLPLMWLGLLFLLR